MPRTSLEVINAVAIVCQVTIPEARKAIDVFKSSQWLSWDWFYNEFTRGVIVGFVKDGTFHIGFNRMEDMTSILGYKQFSDILPTLMHSHRARASQ